MDPYSSPYIIPNNSLHNPFPHSLREVRGDAQQRSYYLGVDMGLLSALTSKLLLKFRLGLVPVVC